MKKSYIFGILIIAVAITIIISTAGDASSYVSFAEAKEMALNGKTSMIHVVGVLKKDDQGKIMGIEASEDKLSFSFVMIDDQGVEQTVFHNEPIPTDFTKSEQVVVVGNYKAETFVADKILLKCPSKYQENTLEEK